MKASYCSGCHRMTYEPFETRSRCACGSYAWYQGTRPTVFTLSEILTAGDPEFIAEAPHHARSTKLGLTNQTAYINRRLRRGES